jgi:AcrR family transcriptional regulator
VSDPKPARARPSHGERTRREILAAAERLAAREGLEGLTIGRLADLVGMSKAGLFAHFGSKEALQLATIDAAHARFVDEVAAPALAAAGGAARLERFLELYFTYLERRADEGGCFFTAASLELDDRPGALRDRVLACIQARDALAVAALDEARCGGELGAATDVEQLAFEVVALAAGAAMAFQLSRDLQALARGRAALARLFRAAGLRRAGAPRPRAAPGAPAGGGEAAAGLGAPRARQATDRGGRAAPGRRAGVSGAR